MFVYFITLCLGYDTNLAARVLESCIQCLSYSAIVCIGVFLILQRLANRGFICLGPLLVTFTVMWDVKYELSQLKTLFQKSNTFIHALTFAWSRGKCLKPRAKREVLNFPRDLANVNE